LLGQVTGVLAESSLVVLSDYAKGVLCERVCRTIIAGAGAAHVPVVVDPKGHDFARYRGATVICPDAKELATVTGGPASDLNRLLTAGQAMTAALGLEFMLVTLGEKGIAILRPDSRRHIPAAARQVYDVSGAGDTVVAVLAVALASGVTIEAAARLANVAAGIVIGKVGTVPIQRGELLGALSQELQSGSEEKVIPTEVLMARVAGWRSRGLQLVLTNGCLDLLHIGHIALLEQARRLGDRLIVAVNSDKSVRRLKGPDRPLVQEQGRARILAALAAVDAVVVFDESTPLRLIEAIRPDVLVKGGDYTEDKVVGAAEVRGWGGRVELVPLVAGCSTTNLIERSWETEHGPLALVGANSHAARHLLAQTRGANGDGVGCYSEAAEHHHFSAGPTGRRGADYAAVPRVEAHVSQCALHGGGTARVPGDSHEQSQHR
jgi:D-beta-D-heptose 7-phosphate kinase/D-beta-D-heptose 1-phosphate adenosyltransferase